MTAEYIDEKAVAERTSLSRVTLQHWRQKAEGPPFAKVGRKVLYKWADVVAWLEARTVKRDV